MPVNVLELKELKCWDYIEPRLVTSETSDGTHISGSGFINDYLLKSAVVDLSPGVYRLETQLCLDSGAVTVGVLDVASNSWLSQINHMNSSSLLQEFKVSFRSEGIVLVLAACSFIGKEQPIDCLLEDYKIQKVGGLLFSWWQSSVGWAQKGKRALYSNVIPHWKLARLQAGIDRRRYYGSLPFEKRLHASSIFGIGYACRAIHIVADGDRHLLLMANTGYGTVDVIDALTQKQIHSIALGEMSAPISLDSCVIAGKPHVLICIFNFDIELAAIDTSALILLPLEELLENSELDPFTVRTLLTRKGSCGYRCVKSTNLSGGIEITAVDRDEDVFHRLLLNRESGEVVQQHSVSLTAGTEAIGFAVHQSEGNAFYYLNSRNKKLLTVVSWDGSELSLMETVALDDFSRSSVCLGQLQEPGKHTVLAALWGGDPKELNTISRGAFILCDVSGDGSLMSPRSFPAGIHPTDIAVGDFDGDGLDEIAVLNYGNGINRDFRRSFGSLEFYKYKGGTMKRLKTLNLPSPRIAAMADLDGDGRDELLVSLFFENKCVVVGHQ